ncbi:hypothetical protein KP509_16G065800 [Ceratopteris richardii]|uniref:Uncharacterized protein n=1 Tax=Ceratopteris richardii TaxID=49495 RepID=A0A8T2T1H1_CERRI|nr:hypothetical protein KP509_16G065800 [Ceratopteris richardii]
MDYWWQMLQRLSSERKQTLKIESKSIKEHRDKREDFNKSPNNRI